LKLNDKLKAAVIIAVVASLVVGTVAAVSYYLGQNNTVQVEVTETQTAIPLTLTTSPSSVTETESFTLTAIATGTNAASADGKTVNFYEGTTLVGTGTITLIGTEYKASVTMSGVDVGVHTYKAGPPP